MATPIIRVDLSAGARDYRPTATEPGLPMLDPQGENYGILRRWFGELVAEPEWEREDTVSFFYRDEERGRRENVECRPTTRSDLEGPQSDGLQALRSKIKRVKPESSTEELLHRIVKRAFADITTDVDSGDHDSYLFKCREGNQPWRLVWCWGYQRADVQPAAALICAQPDCGHLYLRRSKTKVLCPVCQSGIVRRRRGPGLRVPVSALLLLVLLAALVAFFFPAKLAVTPQQWAGPTGSRVDFHAEDALVVLQTRRDSLGHVQSHDSRVIEFDDHGGMAHAKNLGRTRVSLRYQDRVADATVEVLPPTPPESMTIQPEAVTIAVGSTAKLKAIGHYADGTSVDVTEIARWNIEDESLATFIRGGIEGVAAGETTVKALVPRGPDPSQGPGSSQGPEPSQAMVAAATIRIVDVELKALAVRVTPDTFGAGQSSRIEVEAADATGASYSLLGSSRLTMQVEPADVAAIQGDYLQGTKEGSAELRVTFQNLSEKSAFQVGRDTSLAAGVFAITPEKLDLFVDEYFQLDAATASEEPMDSTSSDPGIVEVVGPTEVAGRAPGEATVTVKQGENTQVVQVQVREARIERIEFDPQIIVVDVGSPRTIHLYGIAEDGRRLSLASDRLTWLRQPETQNTLFSRDELQFFGLRPTTEPQYLEVTYGDRLRAAATVEVMGPESVAGGSVAGVEVDQFLVHPPIGVRGVPLRAGALVGDGLLYRGRDVVVGEVDPFSILGEIPRGSVITKVNGDAMRVLDGDGVRRYFADQPIALGDVVEYRAPDGSLSAVSLGSTLGVVQDVKLLEVESKNLTAAEFNAEVLLLLRQEAEYRLSDVQGNSLSDWTDFGPNVTVRITSSKIERTPDDEYEIYVDRRINEIIKRFQIPFKLEPEGS